MTTKRDRVDTTNTIRQPNNREEAIRCIAMLMDDFGLKADILTKTNRTNSTIKEEIRKIRSSLESVINHHFEHIEKEPCLMEDLESTVGLLRGILPAGADDTKRKSNEELGM